MTHLRLISNDDFGSPDSLSMEQKEVLESALAKIVMLGEQIGVTADQMIKLLDAGMTVRELLEFLATRAEQLA